MASLPTRFARNTASSYAVTFVAVTLGIVVTPILVRGLGKEGYGTWVLVTTSVLYLDVLQFGFGRAVVRYVAQALARDDVSAVRSALSTAFYTLCIPGVLLVLLSPVLAWVFPQIFDVSSDLRTAAMVLAVLSALDLAIGIPGDTFGAGLIGYQRYDLMNLTLIATGVGQALAWLVILQLGGGLIQIGVATIVFSVGSQLARLALLRWLVGASPIPPSSYDRGLVGRLASMSAWIAVNDIGGIILARIDVVVVGLIVGVPGAAVYAVGQKLAQLGARVTQPALNLFYPHAAELDAVDDRQGLKDVLFTGSRISLALAAPVAITSSMLAEPFIETWVGDGFEAGATVAICLSMTTLVIAFTRVGIYVLRGMAEVRGPAFLVILESAINLSLSVVLARAIGLEGVAYASLIAAATATCVGFPWICWKIGASSVELFRVLVARTAPASVVALALGLGLRHLGVEGLVQTLASAAAMTGAFAAVFAVTGVSRHERAAIRARIDRRLRRPAG